MADTCIVCLGDLTSGDGNPRSSPEPAQFDGGRVTLDPSTTLTNLKLLTSDAQIDESATIAHLLPCGHNLHNECLKPWVERANSCPICRQNFNQVELRSHIDGPAISSYGVQDKKQVAELDPSMIVEEDLFDDPDVEACLLCEEWGDEDSLLLCDGCNASCHTYCVGLEAVPAGEWFCQFCLEDSVAQSSNVTRPSRLPRRRGNRRAGRREGSPHAWARVWQSVWDHLNLDLDFPFDDDTEQLPAAQRRDIAQWHRRFEVAERQGGAARFRDTAATLLNIQSARNNIGPTPQAESQEELRAWNAFEKAKEQQSGNSASPAGRNKRKSVTTSPAEPEPEPERRLKRPRTRRAQTVGDASDTGGEGTSSARRAEVSTPTTLTGPRPANLNVPGRSFFQSLLKEVETTPASSKTNIRQKQPLKPLSPTPADYASPSSLSRGSSPASSNHPSPRMRPVSPPPYHSRPSSPPPLTSCIEPMFFQQAPKFSPISPPNRPLSDSEETASSGEQSSRRSRPRHREPAEARATSSNATSPRRPEMSFSAKAEIQHMVTSALKPEYRKGKIDTEQYTIVNREISRMLYDKVGEAGGMADGVERERWQSIAAHEVDAALKKLKEREVDVMA